MRMLGKKKKEEKKKEEVKDVKDHPDYDPSIPDSKQRHITR